MRIELNYIVVCRPPKAKPYAVAAMPFLRDAEHFAFELEKRYQSVGVYQVHKYSDLVKQ